MNQPGDFLRLHGPVELVSAETECWKCRNVTPVHSLMAAAVERFDEGEDSWRTDVPCFLSDVGGDLPPAIKARVGVLAPNFKPTHSRTTGETSWANTCVHCQSLQGAHFMHSEPDGPFFAGPEEHCGQRLLLAADGFDVASASYSY